MDRGSNGDPGSVTAHRKGLVGIDSSNDEDLPKLIRLSSLSCSKELYRIVNRRPSTTRRRSLFTRDVYDMVDDPSTDSVVSWSESGKSFIVRNESEFLRDVLPRFLEFHHYRDMTSLTRWFHAIGYRKVEGSEQWEYAGDYLVRGQPVQREPITPCTPGGLMITPEEGRKIERHFAYWKARNQ